MGVRRFGYAPAFGLALGLAVLATVGCAGGVDTDGTFVEHASYDEALVAAGGASRLVLVDFYATWCGPCKRFAADVESDTALREALGETAFVRVDAESPDGGEALAEAFAVSSYPTFVVVGPDGEEIDRWAGYGEAAGFVERLRETLDDPIGRDARIARFENEPTAKDARKLAEAFRSAGELGRAVGYLERAIELDPQGSATDRATIVSTQLRGLRDGTFAIDDVERSTRALAADPRAGADELGRVGDLLAQQAERHDLAGVLAEFLPEALAAIDDRRASATDDEAAWLDDLAGRLRVAVALHVEGDLDRAVELKRASMPDGWQEDAGRLNAFAWWCFENETHVAEATELALRGADLAKPGEERAMILDTAAELCFLGGDRTRAVALIERAIEDDPENDYYREQRERFAGPVAGAAAGEGEATAM